MVKVNSRLVPVKPEEGMQDAGEMIQSAPQPNPQAQPPIQPQLGGQQPVVNQVNNPAAAQEEQKAADEGEVAPAQVKETTAAHAEECRVKKIIKGLH